MTTSWQSTGSHAPQSWGQMPQVSKLSQTPFEHTEHTPQSRWHDAHVSVPEQMPSPHVAQAPQSSGHEKQLSIAAVAHAVAAGLADAAVGGARAAVLRRRADAVAAARADAAVARARRARLGAAARAVAAVRTHAAVVRARRARLARRIAGAVAAARTEAAVLGAAAAVLRAVAGAVAARPGTGRSRSTQLAHVSPPLQAPSPHALARAAVGGAAARSPPRRRRRRCRTPRARRRTSRSPPTSRCGRSPRRARPPRGRRAQTRRRRARRRSQGDAAGPQQEAQPACGTHTISPGTREVGLSEGAGPARGPRRRRAEPSTGTTCGRNIHGGAADGAKAQARRPAVRPGWRSRGGMRSRRRGRRGATEPQAQNERGRRLRRGAAQSAPRCALHPGSGAPRRRLTGGRRPAPGPPPGRPRGPPPGQPRGPPRVSRGAAAGSAAGAAPRVGRGRGLPPQATTRDETETATSARTSFFMGILRKWGGRPPSISRRVNRTQIRRPPTQTPRGDRTAHSFFDEPPGPHRASRKLWEARGAPDAARTGAQGPALRPGRCSASRGGTAITLSCYIFSMSPGTNPWL